MPSTKRIICLANSRKRRGRCVAGREILSDAWGGWIRPVSDRPHEEISWRERTYEDGSDPRVLDVIDVPLIEPRPGTFQRENWLLDPHWYWVKTDRVDPSALVELVDCNGPLWLNRSSTRQGMNDRVSVDDAAALETSLSLIHVEKLSIRVFTPGADFGDRRRRVQARFELGDAHYSLWVTDPVHERRFHAQADGTYDLGPSFLTISLGEPFEDYVYKLVAAIIEETR